MGYMDPHDVLSPQQSLSNLRPITDTGEWGYSVALLNWEREPSIGVRWNGGMEDGAKKPTPGSPQSRGLPTWYILPPPFELAVLYTFRWRVATHLVLILC